MICSSPEPSKCCQHKCDYDDPFKITPYMHNCGFSRLDQECRDLRSQVSSLRSRVLELEYSKKSPSERKREQEEIERLMSLLDQPKIQPPQEFEVTGTLKVKS